MLGFSPEIAAAAAKVRETWTEQDHRERWGRGLNQPYEVPQYTWIGEPAPTIFNERRMPFVGPIDLGVEVEEIEI